MAFSHEITRTCKSSSGSVTVKTTTSSDAEDNRSLSIPDATANQVCTIAIDKDNLKSLFISSNVAVTIYTNDLSSGSPDQTIPIGAGAPLVWCAADSPTVTNPITDDVTVLYITNASGGTAAVEIRVLQDSTP